MKNMIALSVLVSVLFLSGCASRVPNCTSHAPPEFISRAKERGDLSFLAKSIVNGDVCFADGKLYIVEPTFLSKWEKQQLLSLNP